MIFFWDDFAGTDGIEYVTSDAVDVKLLTSTGSGTLDLADTTADTVTMDGRANRPYPPGKLAIDGSEYPASGGYTLTITWAGRDRITQQDQLIGADEDAVGPEDGVTYTLRGYIDDVLVATITGIDAETCDIGLDGNGTARIEVAAVCDAIESWQAAWAAFEYTGSLTLGDYPDWSVGNTIAYTPQTLGGTPPYTYEVTAGALPSGWAIDADTGELTGSALTGSDATYDFTVTVTDSTSPTPLSDDFPYSITVYDDDGNDTRLVCTMQGTDGSTTIPDISYAARTMTAHNGAALTDADFLFGPTALYLDGSNDYVSCALGPIGTSSFTIDAWIKVSNTGTSGGIFGWGAIGSYTGRGVMLVDSSGKLAWYCVSNGATGYLATNAGANLRDGQWHHVAVARSGATYYFFVDGILLKTASGSGTANLSVSTANIGYAYGMAIRAIKDGDGPFRVDDVTPFNPPR